VEVDPGAVRIEEASRCYAGEGRQVVVEANEREVVEIEVHPVMAGLDVEAVDSEDNDVAGVLYVDGAWIGAVPGRHKVEACAREAEVRTDRGSWSMKLELTPREVLALRAVFTAASTPVDHATSGIDHATSGKDGRGDGRALKAVNYTGTGLLAVGGGVMLIDGAGKRKQVKTGLESSVLSVDEAWPLAQAANRSLWLGYGGMSLGLAVGLGARFVWTAAGGPDGASLRMGGAW
jgi:hypothetical protein